MRFAPSLVVAIAVVFVVAAPAVAQHPPAPTPASAGKAPQRAPVKLAEAQLRDATMRFELGTELFKKGRYREAIVELEAARHFMDPPDLDYDLGLCYERVEEFDAAIESFTRYMDKVPGGTRWNYARDRVRWLSARRKTVATMQRAADDLVRQPLRLVGLGVGTSLGFHLNGRDPEGTIFPNGGTYTGDLIVDFVVHPRLAIELWMPVFNMVLVPIVTRDALFWAQVLFKVYVKGGATGFYIAPGIGALLTGPSAYDFPSTTQLQLPVGLGYEIDLGRLGLVFGVRPWVEVEVREPRVGFGVVGQIELLGYIFKARR